MHHPEMTNIVSDTCSQKAAPYPKCFPCKAMLIRPGPCHSCLTGIGENQPRSTFETVDVGSSEHPIMQEPATVTQVGEVEGCMPGIVH